MVKASQAERASMSTQDRSRSPHALNWHWGQFGLVQQGPFLMAQAVSSEVGYLLATDTDWLVHCWQFLIKQVRGMYLEQWLLS